MGHIGLVSPVEKNQAYHNQPSGGLLGAKLAVGWKGGSIYVNKE
jgi:hypothetical protein